MNMTRLLKSTPFRAVAISVAAVAIFGGLLTWHLLQPKFHDVTLELGQPLPSAGDFQNKLAIPFLVTQVTDPNDIDISKVGTQTVELRHGFQSYTVNLTVVDTTAPQVTFHKDITAYINELPKAEDFVKEAKDESKTTVRFLTELVPPQSYGSAQVQVEVADEHGNAVSETCTVHYVWMEREFALELGSKLTKEDLLLNPEGDSHLLDQAVLDQINASGIGTYTITSVDGDHTCTCTVTVADTTAPTLELNKVSVYLTEPVEEKDFIKAYSDISGQVTVTMVTKLDLSKEGSYTVTFEATDPSGNVTRLDTTLEILKDAVGPAFSGMKTITVNKNATPDFTKGVKAVDARDGQVEFTVDTSKVRLNTAGTYYAVYTATDSTGNTTTYRRTVIVNYDSADVDALVKSIAKKLPADAEKLRDYVRNNIRYSHNWGGADPSKGTPEASYVYVWYGFKNKSGNCYVHALCLEALLKEKGFETQLIWATDKSHYWNIVKIDGKWYHIDATPGNRHTKYSLMNDFERYETLYIPEEKRQRDWDRTKWPRCL